MINDREFMLNPDDWGMSFPGRDHRICCCIKHLERAGNRVYPYIFGRLIYADNLFGFIVDSNAGVPDKFPDQAVFDRSKIVWGGPELIDNIIADGWRVD